MYSCDSSSSQGPPPGHLTLPNVTLSAADDQALFELNVRLQYSDDERLLLPALLELGAVVGQDMPAEALLLRPSLLVREGVGGKGSEVACKWYGTLIRGWNRDKGWAVVWVCGGTATSVFERACDTARSQLPCAPHASSSVSGFPTRTRHEQVKEKHCSAGAHMCTPKSFDSV